MRRKVTILTAAALFSALLAGPAAAHVIKVELPRTGEQITTHQAEVFDGFRFVAGSGHAFSMAEKSASAKQCVECRFMDGMRGERGNPHVCVIDGEQ
jgi:hypothetical protein